MSCISKLTICISRRLRGATLCPHQFAMSIPCRCSDIRLGGKRNAGAPTSPISPVHIYSPQFFLILIPSETPGLEHRRSRVSYRPVRVAHGTRYLRPRPSSLRCIHSGDNFGSRHKRWHHPCIGLPVTVLSITLESTWICSKCQRLIPATLPPGMEPAS